LIKASFSWLSKENIEHLVESHDRVTRYVETLNDIRDRAQIINEEIDKLNSAKLNYIINVTQSKKLFHSGDTFFEILNMRFHSGINAICNHGKKLTGGFRASCPRNASPYFGTQRRDHGYFKGNESVQ
jgi:hypothetical protein